MLSNYPYNMEQAGLFPSIPDEERVTFRKIHLCDCLRTEYDRSDEASFYLKGRLPRSFANPMFAIPHCKMAKALAVTGKLYKERFFAKEAQNDRCIACHPERSEGSYQS